MIRYLTSGESHGRCLLAIIDGVPSGLGLTAGCVDADLARRMRGYGRGKRMSIEKDRCEILSGLRKGLTIGSPISLMIKNKDYSIDKLPAVHNVRPGHADLAGVLKYDLDDARSVLERASARETAARVGVGAVAKKLLAEFGVKVVSHVVIIGGVEANNGGMSVRQIVKAAEKSPVGCADAGASRRMCREIDKASLEGDTLGGVFEIIASGVPAGLGSYAQWDRGIDANLARAVMSIQAVKGVDFGIGFMAAMVKGSSVHDEIFYDRSRGFYRNTNNAGGIEGGMTNGQDIVLQAVMKPISTLRRSLSSVNLKTKKTSLASVERSDVCAVPAAAVIGEAVVAIEVANAMCEKFGGDSVGEMRRNFEGYIKQVKNY